MDMCHGNRLKCYQKLPYENLIVIFFYFSAYLDLKIFFKLNDSEMVSFCPTLRSNEGKIKVFCKWGITLSLWSSVTFLAN